MLIERLIIIYRNIYFSSVGVIRDLSQLIIITVINYAIIISEMYLEANISFRQHFGDVYRYTTT